MKDRTTELFGENDPRILDTPSSDLQTEGGMRWYEWAAIAVMCVAVFAAIAVYGHHRAAVLTQRFEGPAQVQHR